MRRAPEDIFNDALDVPAVDRDRFVDEACGEDERLRGEVKSLLAAYETAGGFLAEPVLVEVLGDFTIDEVNEDVEIETWRLEQRLGSGGMGDVYLGHREGTDFQQSAAIKLIRRGMDTGDILERFRAERRLLARLEHPNIARLLDGGASADGRPYLAMEYVNGLPITAYCREHALLIEPRLKLFLQVCEAVDYAHRNLVIHRDLKPSNILVTDDGAVKLLDFGIAKLVMSEDDGETPDLTRTQQRMLTPRYASPEQLRGGAISTATDVYALGVVLYQLLTGRDPYRVTERSSEALERAVCEQAPTRPSTSLTRAGDSDREWAPPPGDAARLRRRLSGDLDTIVLMALRKEPERRYASVREFAEDIERHLAGLPVRARPDTFAYRADRFVRRHRVPVAAAALLFIASIAFGIVSSTLYVRAEHQRELANIATTKAEQRFEQVRELANVMMFDVHDQIARLPGATPAREFLVDTSLAYLDGLAAETGDDPDLQQELARGYERLGQVLGLETIGNLGDVAGSLASFRKAESIWLDLLERDPDDDQLTLSFASNQRSIGDVLYVSGDLGGALNRFRETKRIAEEVLARQPDMARAMRTLFVGHTQLGKVLGATGDGVEAVEHYRLAREIIASLAAREPDRVEHRRDLQVTCRALGEQLLEFGELDDAEAHGRRSVELARELLADDPDNAQYQSDLADGLRVVGDVALRRQEFDHALAVYEDSLEVIRPVAEADPENAMAQRMLSIAHEHVGDAQLESGSPELARREYETALELTMARAEADPNNRRSIRDVALCSGKLGRVLMFLGEVDAAEMSFRRGIAHAESLLNDDPSDTKARRVLVEAHQGLADALRTREDPGTENAYRRYFELADAAAQRYADEGWTYRHMGTAAWFLGGLIEQRANDEALPLADRLGLLEEARSWFEAGRRSALSLRDRGLMRPGEEQIPDLFAADVERCAKRRAELLAGPAESNLPEG